MASDISEDATNPSHKAVQPDQDEQHTRRVDAAEFYRQHCNPQEIQQCLQAADYRYPVTHGYFESGTVLQRREVGDDAIPSGPWFTRPGTSEDGLALHDVLKNQPDAEAVTGNEIDSDLSPDSVHTVQNTDFFVVREGMRVEYLQSTAANQSSPTDGKFNPAGLLYTGGKEQFYIPRDQLSHLERVVCSKHPGDHDRRSDGSISPASGAEQAVSDGHSAVVQPSGMSHSCPTSREDYFGITPAECVERPGTECSQPSPVEQTSQNLRADDGPQHSL